MLRFLHMGEMTPEDQINILRKVTIAINEIYSYDKTIYKGEPDTKPFTESVREALGFLEAFARG